MSGAILFSFLFSLAILSYFFFRITKKEKVLLLVSVITTFLILEIILRSFFPQINEHNQMFEFDEKLGWKFRPNKKGHIIYANEANHFIQTNSIGFRDNPVSLDNKEKNKRILMLGDSFVSNISVKREEIFTEILEANLIDTEVLNFGVNGYGTVQEYLLLEECYDKIKPDIVLLMIYLRNDFKDNIGGYWLYPRPYASWNTERDTCQIISTPAQKYHEGVAPIPFWKSYKKSHVFTLIKTKIKAINAKYFSNDQPSKYTPQELFLCRSELTDEAKLMYKTMEAVLLKMATFCKNVDVPLVVVLAPSHVQIDDDLWSTTMFDYGENLNEFERTLPNDKLMNFAKENNLRMIDLYPELKTASEKGKALYNAYEQHWTTEGNEEVANILLNYIKNESLIE